MLLIRNPDSCVRERIYRSTYFLVQVVPRLVDPVARRPSPVASHTPLALCARPHALSKNIEADYLVMSLRHWNVARGISQRSLCSCYPPSPTALIARNMCYPVSVRTWGLRARVRLAIFVIQIPPNLRRSFPISRSTISMLCFSMPPGEGTSRVYLPHAPNPLTPVW